MKQKRKVKSLLPQKNDLWGSLLTATLLVLGLALCLWSASLMTSSVWAASSNPAEYSQFQYSWTDDKVEVLYNLQFSKPEYLSGFVGEMYTDKNNDFYITSTPITVNESGVKAEDVNEVDKWLYSNILGWHKNKVHSNYVTTIWWEENVIATWNPNAVIFWWKNNEISWSATWNPSVIIWWHHNLIKGGHNWNTIIWWHDNSISWSVSNSFILGWINNKIVSDKWINNVIVWGSNVTVDTWDVFVFSDSAFKPEGTKTFYLNVSQWLWINAQSAGKWVTVNGPVKFGEIYITKPEYPCDSNHYGIIWSWNGCLVWCTPTTAVEGKWDLLDRWERCQKDCDSPEYNNYCSQKKPEVDEPEAYSGFCTDGVNTANASPCTPVWDEVKDVVFETALINSEQYGGKCPGSGAVNKCIYQCNSGYYLTWDLTKSDNVKVKGQKACYSICDLSIDLWPEWVDDKGNPIILKHNEMVTGYNTNETTCARTKPYEDPWDKYGKDKWTKGDDFPEHCGNNQHKQPLVCVNWKMEIAKDFNNPESKNQNAAAKWYIHRNCAVHEFTCDTTPGKFDLKRDYITTTLLDNSIVKDTPKDRDKMIWTRWTYKLCLDYDVLASPLNEKVPWNETCNVHLWNNTPYVEHYQFVWCNENQGYHRSTRDWETDKYICRKECKIDTNEGIKPVWDNKSIILYKWPKELCENNKWEAWKYICQEHTFTCDDGQWKVEDRPYIGLYTYTTCTQEWVACWSPYDVPADKRANFDVTYYSAPCHRWYAYSNTITKTYQTRWSKESGYARYGYTSIQDPCIDGWDHYQLLWCQDCHHATSQYYCDKELNAEFISFCSTSEAWKVAKWYNYKYWSSTSWYGGKMENKGKCYYYCDYDNDYYDCGSSCCKNKTLSEIQKSCDDRPEDGTWIRVELDTKVEGNADWFRYEVYSTTGSNSGSRIDYTDWCFDGCKSTDSRGRELRRAGTDCELKYQTYDCVGTLPEHASVVGSDSHYWTTPEEYYWNPSGWDCAFKCDDGYEWDEVSHACLYKGWNCGAKCSYNVTFDPNGWTIKWTAPDNVECGGTIHMPNVERSCYKFLGWNDGNKKYAIWAPYQVNSFVWFTAEWERDTSKPECKYDCLAPEPRFDATTMERSDKKPEWDGEHWSRVTHNGDLTACQWRCKLEYKVTSDGLWCEKKPCQENSAGNDPWLNPPTSIEWVIKWPETYVWTDTRRWKRITSWEPVECQWRCDTEHYYEFDSLTRTCVKKVPAWCAPDATNPKHYQCTEGSTPTGTGTITNGWKWNCEWKDKVTCLECELWYKKNTTSNTCVPYKCKTPAPSGEGVLKWPSTYTGVGVADGKGWDYLTGKTQSELKACEWSCKLWFKKSGDKCIPINNAKCSKPEVHNHCEDDTTMDAKNPQELRDSSLKLAWWTWDCVPKSGTTGDIAECLECNEDMWFKEVEVNGKRTCVKDQDGKCAYDWSYCSAWTSGLVTDITANWKSIWKHWICEGIGNWKNEKCQVAWECGGSCSYYGDAGCKSDAQMYTSYEVFSKSDCESAGYRKMSGGGVEPCYLTNPMAFPYQLIPSCSGTYGSCAKWTAKLECRQGPAGNVTSYYGNEAIEQCKSISDMKPNCTDSEPVKPTAGGDYEHVYHAEVVGTQWNDAMIRVWTDDNVPKDVTFKIHYKYNIGGWFQHDVDITIPAWEDMASSSWLYVWGRNGCDVRIDHALQSNVVVKDWKDTHTFVYEGNDDCERKIPVTVEYHWLTPQRYYQDFLLIKAGGGHVQSNCSLVWDNNGTHWYCSFEVPADWIGKKVGTQFMVHDANWYGFSTAQASNDDWVITDYYTKLDYYTQI